MSPEQKLGLYQPKPLSDQSRELLASREKQKAFLMAKPPLPYRFKTETMKRIEEATGLPVDVALFSSHWLERRPLLKIARELGTAPTTISKTMKHLGILVYNRLSFRHVPQDEFFESALELWLERRVVFRSHDTGDSNSNGVPRYVPRSVAWSTIRTPEELGINDEQHGQLLREARRLRIIA